jgi:omega-amidase
MAGEDKVYAPGQSKLLVECKGWKICPMICYDLRFPVWIRNVENYDLLIFVANWPEKRIHHWKALLPARSIENQSYALGVNRVGMDGNEFTYTGSSMAIGPMGNSLIEIQNEEKIEIITLDYEEITKVRRYMPFLADRDGFEIS